MEIELKLLLKREDVDALKKHSVIRRHAKKPSSRHRQTALYFDTPDCLLKKSDAGLRVRESNGAWTQTMKAGGKIVAGLHQRHEWETAVPDATLDLYALRKIMDPKEPWRELISSPNIARTLIPVFQTNVHRTTWDLHMPNDCVIEMVLDEGEVRSEDRQEAICEIELELKSGSALQLFDTALALLKDIPMRLGSESKAARGYALYEQSSHAIVKARRLALQADMTIEQAFEAIVENCVQQIQGNEPGIAQGRNVENLHQIRVGLRRLKSAFALFNDAIALPQALQHDIDWLSDQISAARDWDVLATSTLNALSSKDDEHAENIDKIRQAAEVQALRMHQVAAAAIHSPRYATFMLSLMRWMVAKGWRDDDDAASASKDNHLDQKLKPFSGKLLKQDRKRLASRGRDLEKADARKRHRVRIAAKKMRYDTEFFSELYAPKETRAYLKALSQLQDKLGWLNDVAIGDGLLAELPSHQADLEPAADYVRGYLSARATRDQKKIGKLWKKFKTRHLTDKK